MTHPLSGADIGTLRRVMREAGGTDRWLRTLAIWAAVLGRLPFTTLECILVGQKLPKLEDVPPPIFILGHWRSGTTHLYNAMSLGDFGYISPIAAGMPWDMFGLARVLRPLLEQKLPVRRYVDDMGVSPTSPQEDEIAIANMSVISFYHGIYFPRHFDRLIDRGLFFEGCAESEIEGWRSRFTYLIRRLALQQGRRLLIKNPVYTARPAMLREIFPSAKFIHIHRNPYDVVYSMKNFFEQLLPVLALQNVPDNLDIEATVLRVYIRMMTEFDRQTSGWAPPGFIELPYDLLDRKPMAALEHIYEGLALDGFAEATPRFQAYLDDVKSFRKNVFQGDSDTIQRIGKALAPWIKKWGYSDTGVRPEGWSENGSGSGDRQ